MENHIQLSAPLTAELDHDKEVVHISAYGENLISLTFDDIEKLFTSIEFL